MKGQLGIVFVEHVGMYLCGVYVCMCVMCVRVWRYHTSMQRFQSIKIGLSVMGGSRPRIHLDGGVCLERRAIKLGRGIERLPGRE